MRHFLLTLLCLSFWLPVTAVRARTLFAGDSVLGVQVGPAFSLGHALGASRAYGSAGLLAEHLFNPQVSALVNFDCSVGSNVDLRLRLGPRWRLAGSESLWVPFVQTQFVLGRLLDVIGASLQFIGGSVGAGLEYSLASNLTVSGAVVSDLGSTAGERPIFYGVVDLLLALSWQL